MKTPNKKVYWLARTCAHIGGWMLLISAFGVAAEVILRKIFVISISGANEIAGYAFAVGACWAAAFALLERANIRIDAVYRLLPHRLGSLLDIFALGCFLSFVVFLMWRVGLVLLESIELGARSNTTLGISLWVPQSLWFLGMVGVSAVGFMLLVKSIGAFREGDLRSVTHLIGTVGVEAELEQRMADAAERLKTEEDALP